jgi:hypothetical protein
MRSQPLVPQRVAAGAGMAAVRCFVAKGFYRLSWTDTINEVFKITMHKKCEYAVHYR